MSKTYFQVSLRKTRLQHSLMNHYLPLIGRAAETVRAKHSKRAMLASLYAQTLESVGTPVPLESHAIVTFRLALGEHLELCRKRAELERTAHGLLRDNPDYLILRSVPGIGPIIALTILAEAGDLRRFGHERHFLKFCGLDLCTGAVGDFPRPLAKLQAMQRPSTRGALAGGDRRHRDK